MNFFSNILTTSVKKELIQTDLGNASIGIPEFIKVLFSLTLIGLSIQFFHIEESLKLIELMKVVIPGFIVYAFLPLRLRMPFFFLLNVIALFLLFGFQNGLAILTLCLLFIGLTGLPIAWKYRAFLILIATLLLAAFRVEYFKWGASTTVVTIVGVLIMFRSLLYMYELQYEKQDPGVWKRINYFMLLPNLVFFIFPIVDYKTFIRNYYDKPAFENYSKGLKYMFTGVTHFLIYRILYYYFMPAPGDVKTIYTLIQYMVVSYALIIRLSGLFHFSAGVICLFGFNLPETFSNYFLSSSFSDLWRRINIYWKDFVMKVFYFPIYFKFKKRNNRAIFITVIIVFFFNWFFHAYQWFWIRGAFLLKANDILFWAALGLFVAINSVYQKNTKVKKSSGDFVAGQALSQTGKILGMYALMSFLWVFWTSPSIPTWWDFMTGISPIGAHDLLYITGGIIALLLIGTGAHYLYHQYSRNRKNLSALNTPSLSVVNAVLLALVLTGNPLASQKISTALNFDASPILTTKLNKSDQQQLFKGYYDELIVGNNLNSRMWEVEQEKPQGWGKLKSTGILIDRDDILNKEIKPNQKIIFKDKTFSTNEYGLRDKFYPLEKPEGNLRIAILGGSIEIGSGVNDEDTYENVLEKKLNDSKTFDAYKEVEIINFAISGIHMPQHVPITERSVRPFKPDVLIYTAHTNEIFRSLRRFAMVMNKREKIKDYPFLLELFDKLEIDPTMNEGKARNKLADYGEELHDWGMDQILKVCKEDGILPIMVYIQALGDDPMKTENLELKAKAEAKGFYFIDLYDIFNDVDHLEMATASYDMHPNEKGHDRIAQRLFEIFQTDQELRKLILDQKNQ